MTASAFDLVISGQAHAQLQTHLFPGDGKEAAAILLCRHTLPARLKLMVVAVRPVEHAQCQRECDALVWPGQALSAAIDEAEDLGLSIILAHSHPGGWLDFSQTDDRSDAATMAAIFGGWSGPLPAAGHGSAVMTPDGRLIARLYGPEFSPIPVGLIAVAGDDLCFWAHGDRDDRPMAFSTGMTRKLGHLRACVIGVSGTGSIIAEQVARLGFGALTLIDFDHVEAKNLNRILNSTSEDARSSRLKVEMFADAVGRHRPDLEVLALAQSIATREAVLAAAGADVLFSCVDTAEGRQIADLIAQAFMIPLFDMGVSIPTRRTPTGEAVVAEVSGRLDYVQPGGATLGDRGVYTPALLRAEYLARVAPETFAAEREAGYIKGAPDQAPSVISLNMRAASAAMLEFIARAFPFRHQPNRRQARTIFALADGDEDLYSEDDFTASSQPGTGAVEPLLGLPALGA